MRLSSTLPFFLLVLMGCNLFSKSAEPQLPPATQEGNNTFGFRLNGEIWIPKGFDGTANLDVTYEPTFQGGSLGVSAYSKGAKVNQYISFGGNNISSTGTYVVVGSVPMSPGAYFSDLVSECVYNEPSDSVSGSFTITKLDLVTGVVSGTFEFVFSKAGCQTISATEGRFDIKI